MQPSIFNPWAWRDPSALAGGYTQATPSVTPPDAPDGGHDGPDAPGPGTPVDLVGYQVQASDGRIGSIDEASNEADAGYLVVDTGPWIFGQKVLLPAGTVAQVDHQERVVHVDRSRQEIKDPPRSIRLPSIRNTGIASAGTTPTGTFPLPGACRG